MSEITATISSLQQADQLLQTNIDCLYFGERNYGLRLPASFSEAEQRELVQKIHQSGKKAVVACNALLHPEQIKALPAYLHFLADIQIDQVVLGDPGAVFILQQEQLDLNFCYDGGPLITNARQVNFWKKRGAAAVVLGREVTGKELERMAPQLKIFPEILVYGPTCIHHSKRALLQNYFRYTQQTHDYDQSSHLYLAEPEAQETHYGIYEDQHGTHIFSNQDIQLLAYLPHLAELGFSNWKLDGLFCPEADFVAIVSAFLKARAALEADEWTPEIAAELLDLIAAHHSAFRGMDQGFYPLAAKDIQ